ncbi:hypothetical protein Tco_1319353 [Tanacetum coccineum]
MMLIFGLLETLEMEALVDAMDVDNARWFDVQREVSASVCSGRGRHFIVLIVERDQEELRMTCLDDGEEKKIRNDVPCHDHFEVKRIENEAKTFDRRGDRQFRGTVPGGQPGPIRALDSLALAFKCVSLLRVL